MPKENIESGRRIQVRNKDIFNPKDNRENKQNDKFGDMAVFTLTGKQDIYIDGYPVLEDMERNGRFVEAEDHDAAYAKRVAGNRIRYFIKFGGVGGRMFDPTGIEGDGYGRKRLHGATEYKWREVNKRAFNYYIEYLKTKNKAYFRNAEREAM